MADLPPLLFDAAGPVATPPATLRQQLIDLVAAAVPGYTANLPGSMIEDMTSTGQGILTTIDQTRVDALNGVSPYAANPYTLAQQGQQFGIPQGAATNGSVYVVFSGSIGYVIPPGFTVSDGTHQFVIQDGGVIGSSGSSPSLYAVATTSDVFAIPANTVTQIITPVTNPPYVVGCTNPLAGAAAQSPETIESYRARLMQASQLSFPGTQAYLKTLLKAVAGVSSRLVAVIQNSTKWEVLCGGGDPYDVAYAIYKGVSQVGLLVGSSTTARNQTVDIYDEPDTYSVIFVVPPAQAVTLDITWNTTLSGFTAGASLNQLAIAAAQQYLNGILVGQSINLLVLDRTIQAAVAPVLDPINLTTLTYAVTIDTVPVTPTAGTSIIPGDPESYFAAAANAVTCVQG